MSGLAALVGRDARALSLWAAVDAYRELIAAASVADLIGMGSAAYYLRAVALESAIADGAARGVAVGIHQALMAGADLGEVAEAAGMDTAQVAHRWMAWAHGQRRLWTETATLGLCESDYARVVAVLEAAPAGDGGAPASSQRPPSGPMGK